VIFVVFVVEFNFFGDGNVNGNGHERRGSYLAI
jgi:hypothetical protein